MNQKEVSLAEVYGKLFNSFKRRAILWIVILGFVVFSNTLLNGFVWDDIGQIVNNSDIYSISNIGSFFFGSYDPDGNLIKIPAIFYRPLMKSAFAIVYFFFGLDPFFFHLISMVFHIGIAILVFFLFRRFFKPLLSFILAIIFLIHPLNAEVANYISSYNDLMYLFFGLLSLILIPTGKIISIKRWVLIFSCILLSLISKESGYQDKGGSDKWRHKYSKHNNSMGISKLV